MMRLKHDSRGISNVIVVMLSLVLIVVIAANVVLWSYQMNQFDWERTQEKIEIINSESGRAFSPLFKTQTEYLMENGSLISGSYTDTQEAEDGLWETFQEVSTSPPRYRLCMNGTFKIDIANYPLNAIHTVEILLKYNISDIEEKIYLRAYNWTSKTYSRFEGDSGDIPFMPNEWSDYTINLTDHWSSYVRDDGLMYIQIQDEKLELPSENQTKLSVDFLGVRLYGWSWTSVSLINKGSITVHIVSLWVINSTRHERYDMNFFLNSGQNATYIRIGEDLLVEQSLIKMVTERGNKAILRNQ